MKKIKGVYAWTWKIKFSGKWELCKWAHPTKAQLLRGSKPSPEAEPIRVRMVT